MKTAEYVRRGHPDRACDIISDSIIDAYLEKDPDSRLAIDVFGCHGTIIVGGEVTSDAEINISEIVRSTYKEIGYKDEIKEIKLIIAKQSPEINDLANEGAGDSGICTGYATNETPEMLPLEVVLVKRICDGFDDQKDERFGPDGKAQVTLENGKIKIVVFSYQVMEADMIKFVKEKISKILEGYLTENTIWHLTPFKSGGFNADSGLTGRKNALWYGPKIPIGGGAFAGKDATKVDRSGAYLARSIAIAHTKEPQAEVFVEIVYAIGKNQPLYIKVNGIEVNSDEFSVKNIIEKFDLKKPIYKKASIKGHFGTNEFSWDK